jgi:hypothetical protein
MPRKRKEKNSPTTRTEKDGPHSPPNRTIGDSPSQHDPEPEHRNPMRAPGQDSSKPKDRSNIDADEAYGQTQIPHRNDSADRVRATCQPARPLTTRHRRLKRTQTNRPIILAVPRALTIPGSSQVVIIPYHHMMSAAARAAPTTVEASERTIQGMAHRRGAPIPKKATGTRGKTRTQAPKIPRLAKSAKSVQRNLRESRISIARD